MFRSMRRSAQELTREENEAVLKNASSGVLALLGDDDYPYAVPLNHVYEAPNLYFHCALTGHKMDAVRRHGKASFCVVANDDIVPEKLTTAYRSVIAFGRVREVTDRSEKLAVAMALAARYSPGFEKERDQDIAENLDRMGVIALEIEHMTGKAGKEFLRRRKEGTV